MKKIGLIATILVAGLVLSGCNNEQKTIEQDNPILTGGFSPAPKVEKISPEEPEMSEISDKIKDIDFSKIDIRTINLQELSPVEKQYLYESLDWGKLSVDEKTYLIHGHDPFVYEEKSETYSINSKIIHEGCDKYINNEFGFQIDLSKWKDCKITYSETLDLDGNVISRRFVLWSLPLNNYGRFEGWEAFARIVILSKDEEIKYEDPLFDYDAVSAVNNKYNYYLVLGNADASLFYTYTPTKYKDFICEGAHEGENGIIFDSDGCHCGEEDSDWEIRGIDMPKPARSIRCMVSDLIKQSFSVFNI